MAYSWVSEPRLTVWLRDKPLFYRTSFGQEISFSLDFKSTTGANGVIDTSDPAIFSLGTNWHTPWRSYLQKIDVIKRLVVLGNGSARQYVLDVTDYGSRAKLTGEDDDYVLQLSSGYKYYYYTPVTLGQRTNVFLSKIEDPQGRGTFFSYSITTNSVRLSKVTDPDGRETTLSYTNTPCYPNLIFQVTSPYGQTATLNYNTNGQLIKITDVIGLESQMEYDSSNRLSTLITSYGTNSFSYYSGTNSGETNVWKAVRISHQTVRNQFYLSGFNAQNALPSATNQSEDLIQVLQNAGLSQCLETNGFDERNTFYWGPRQYDNLPQSIRSSLTNTTFNPTNLTGNDLQLGWSKHWLKNRGTSLPSSSVAIERAPSPNADGSTEGLYTWYDYAEKKDGDPSIEGKMTLPLIVAQRDQDSLWRIQHATRNSKGNPTTLKETYGDTWGHLLWRTNDIVYAANELDLVSLTVSGPAASAIQTIYNTYNGDGTLSYSTDALDQTTSYNYAGKRVTCIARCNGWVTDYTYDADGWLTNVVERGDYSGYFKTNSFTYTNSQVQTHTDERGLVVTNLWDTLGRLIRISYPDGTFVTNAYDKLHLAWTVDRMGFTNRYERNSFGEVVRLIDARNNTNSYDYCTCGLLDSMTDPIGNTTIFSYDNLGRRVTVTYPGGAVVTNTYDLFNRPSIVSDSAGSVTNRYVLQGLLSQSSDGSGTLSGMRYDFVDRAIALTNVNGVSYAQEFDAIGRVTARRYPDSDAQYGSEFFYYNVGWGGIALEVTYEDQLGQLTVYENDELGRKTNEIYYSAAAAPLLTNRFSYGCGDELLTLSDGKKQTTTWRYDEYGRVTNKLDYLGTNLFAYTYDANGRVTSRWTPGTNGPGITTRYSYDAVGNLTTVDYTNSADVTLQYDALNRVTNMVDAVGTTRYTYTAFGAVASEDGPWGSDSVSYVYNNSRLRSGLSLLQPNTSPWTQSYAYDAARRLTELTSLAGTFRYSYDPTAKSMVGRLMLPGGAYVTNAYDAMARLTNTCLKNNAHAALNSHGYAYNAGHQRTLQTRTGGDYVDYTYDGLGQLTAATGKEKFGTTNRWQERFSYGYDAAWNLTNRTQNVLTNVFSVNSLNELTSVGRSGTLTVAGGVQGTPTSITVSTNGVSAGNAIRYADNTFALTNVALLNGTNTFMAVATDALSRYDTNTVTAYLPATLTLAYDLNGNLRTNGTRLFDYDDENQLTRITEPGAWKSEFTYDGKMRRRVRTEAAWSGGAWATNLLVCYTYDGNLVLQERHYNPQISTSIAQQTMTYTRGNDLSGSLEAAGGIGGLLARSQSEISNPQSAFHSYYHADGNGNVTCLIATNQTVAARYLYDPFGNPLSAVGPLAEANLYRFSSKEWHLASALVYYGYRFYDPSLQRWPNRDPLGEVDSANLYEFVSNNPYDWYDPFGEQRGAPPPRLPPRQPPRRPTPRDPPPPRVPRTPPKTPPPPPRGCVVMRIVTQEDVHLLEVWEKIKQAGHPIPTTPPTFPPPYPPAPPHTPCRWNPVPEITIIICYPERGPILTAPW